MVCTVYSVGTNIPKFENMGNQTNSDLSYVSGWTQGLRIRDCAPVHRNISKMFPKKIIKFKIKFKITVKNKFGTFHGPFSKQNLFSRKSNPGINYFKIRRSGIPGSLQTLSHRTTYSHERRTTTPKQASQPASQ